MVQAGLQPAGHRSRGVCASLQGSPVAPFREECRCRTGDDTSGHPPQDVPAASPGTFHLSISSEAVARWLLLRRVGAAEGAALTDGGSPWPRQSASIWGRRTRWRQ